MHLVETIGLTIVSVVGFTLLGMIISKIRKPKLPEDVKAELQKKAAETDTVEDLPIKTEETTEELLKDEKPAESNTTGDLPMKTEDPSEGALKNGEPTGDHESSD